MSDKCQAVLRQVAQHIAVVRAALDQPAEDAAAQWDLRAPASCVGLVFRFRIDACRLIAVWKGRITPK